MLSNRHFYFELTRKYVILFGNMFNNISMIRKNRDTGVELERIKVPLTYASKEKYFIRLNSDPDLERAIQVTLPRMSFELKSLSYDASRKQNSLLKNPKGYSSTQASSQFMGVPYDLMFELNIYTKTVDDGTHIIEQILPYFNPDYTVTINPIPEIGFLKDIPITMTGISNSVEHEGGFDAVRYVNWTLTFTLKGYYYGPVTQSKIIREVDVNFFTDPALRGGYITKLNLHFGNNIDYRLNDIVFQGDTYETATSYGFVHKWNKLTANTGKLELAGVQGQLKANSVIRATSTGANYTIQSFDATPIKLVNIDIKPNPLDAEPGDDYGYTTTITEWPETET
jgi:hypothetical protein